MDIRTLPEKEREIYNRIKKDYSVKFEPFKIGNHSIRLLKAVDLDDFIGGENPFENVSEFPFWIKLWESAMVLSYVLANIPVNKGETLMELGAGLGAPGLAAASVGFDVTITDYEDLILDFQRVSAAASGLTNVKVSFLDWLNPSDECQYDILAGAEILFREEFFEPLLHIFRNYLKPDGTIYLAHDASRQSLPKFLKLAQNDFDIAINKQAVTTHGKEKVIIINRLKRK